MTSTHYLSLEIRGHTVEVEIEVDTDVHEHQESYEHFGHRSTRMELEFEHTVVGFSFTVSPKSRGWCILSKYIDLVSYEEVQKEVESWFEDAGNELDEKASEMN